MKTIIHKSKDLLQIVSRSFALCIPLLEKNKINEVENMYLLSRVLDTIEDSSFDIEKKKSLMKVFFRTLDNGKDVDNFVQELQEGAIDDHDKILGVKENYKLILDTFYLLDKPIREVSIKLLLEMSSGMQKYLENEIKQFADLDDYCYYVAGVIGIYMTKLVELKDGIQLDQKQAINLGRYLQKVNIIKNFHKDHQEGRSFWPSSLFNNDRESIVNGENKDKALLILKKMIKNAMKESEAAFEYIASIPYELNGYRKFTLLSAFMASESLRLMHNNPEIFTNPLGVKIPRDRMPNILNMVEKTSHSNEILRKYQQELTSIF